MADQPASLDLLDAHLKVLAERDRYRQALEQIASRPTFERNPDGMDQAAASMQLLAREALKVKQSGAGELPARGAHPSLTARS